MDRTTSCAPSAAGSRPRKRSICEAPVAPAACREPGGELPLRERQSAWPGLMRARLQRGDRSSLIPLIDRGHDHAPFRDPAEAPPALLPCEAHAIRPRFMSPAASPPSPRTLSTFLLLVAALVFAMVLIGGITRLTESGL